MHLSNAKVIQKGFEKDYKRFAIRLKFFFNFKSGSDQPICFKCLTNERKIDLYEEKLRSSPFHHTSGYVF